jgi:uncharacterized RDD family membrane protein YckC
VTPNTDVPVPPLVPDQALAGYWQRILGFGVDIFLMFGVTVGIAILGGVEFDEIAVTDDWPTSVRVAQFIAVGLYYVILTGWRGETLGKMTVGTRVVEAKTGVIPTWLSSTIRWAVVGVAGILPVPFLSVLVYGVVALDPRRRGLHDFGAGTVVVDVRRYRATQGVDGPN